MKLYHTRYLRFIHFFLVFFFVQTAKAQYLSYYTFSHDVVAYTPLSGASSLVVGNSISNQSYAVTLPFNFVFNNVSYSSVTVAANGYLCFGSSNPGTGYWMLNSSGTGFQVFSGFDFDLASAGNNSEISYAISGVSPNRVFTAQWYKMGASAAPGALSASFQIKLFETTNDIYVQYDTITLNAASNISVQLGLRGNNNTEFKNRTCSGNGWLTTSQGSTAADALTYWGGFNPPVGLRYKYTAPPSCSSPGVISAITFNSGNTNISGTFTAVSPPATNYLVVRTNDSTVLNAAPSNGTVYTVGSAIGNGTVVQISSAASFNNTGLPFATNYTYTIFPYNNSNCFGGPIYAAGTSGTYTTKGPRQYKWLPMSGSASYTVAANWTPSRLSPDAMDTLIFDNGGTSTVVDMPTESISNLQFKNSSNITFQSNANDSLRIYHLLQIESGSSLLMNGSYPYLIVFNAAGLARANIYGTISVTDQCKVNMHYCKTKVSGVVNVLSANANFYNSCGASCTTDSLIVQAGAYLNLQRNGPTIPAGLYDDASTIRLAGIVNSVPTSPASSLYVGHLIIDAPNNGISFVLPNAIDKIKGDFTVLSSGSGTITCQFITIDGLTSLNKAKVNMNNVVMIGSLMMDSSVWGIGNSVELRGDLYTGLQDSIKTLSSVSVLAFRGTVQQSLNLNGIFSISNGASILFDNAYGVVLSGTINLPYGKINISDGSISGSGSINYFGLSELRYTLGHEHYATNVEWPAVNSPAFFTIDMNASGQNSRVHLPGSRTISGALYVENGQIVLDNYDLHLGLSGIQSSMSATDSTNKMICTNGTGMLWQTFSPSTSSVLFPIGDIDLVENYSPVYINMNNANATFEIGCRVVDSVHSLAGPLAMSRYWKISDLSGASYNYSLDFKTPVQDAAANNTELVKWDGIAWQFVQAGVNGTTISTPISNSNVVNINGEYTTYDYYPSSPNIYTWNGSQGYDFQNASNWSPARLTPLSTDQLVFNNAIVDTVNNFPTQTIYRLSITNNTTVVFNQTSGTKTITIAGDNDVNTNELFVGTGSSVTFAGSQLFLNFGGSNNRSLIDGKLAVNNPFNSGLSILNFNNGICKISAGGVLENKYVFAINGIVSDSSNLQIAGKYIHNYANNIGYVPYAKWLDGSELYMTGATSAFGSSSTGIGLNQSFYDFTVDHPLLNGNVSLIASDFDTVRHTLKIISTGTGTFRLGNCGTTNYLQLGGRFLMNLFFLADSFVQLGGSIGVPTSMTGNLYFNGSNQQYIQLIDSSTSGTLSYFVNNPNGIKIVGTGMLSSSPIFKINNNAKLSIATTIPFPVQTDLLFSYTGTNAELEYALNGNVTADSVVFPALNGPNKLTIKIGASNIFTLPFSRTVANNLTMTSGHIQLLTNDLTLGSSASSVGILNYTANNYILSKGGYFYRWFNTTSTPLSFTMAFPLADSLYYNKTVSLNFSSNSALSAGGTIGARFMNGSGFTTGLNIADGASTVTNITNGKWEFAAGNGIVANGTIGIQLIANNMGLYGAASNYRVVQSAGAPGNHIAASGAVPVYTVARNGLSIAQLTADGFRVGSGVINTGNDVFSVNSGAWSNPATWNINAVPTSVHRVHIMPSHTVTVSAASVAYNIFVKQSAKLALVSDSLIVDSAVVNEGTFALNGGHFRLGPGGGDKRPFMTLGGTFEVTAGTAAINGPLSIVGTYNLTGGDVYVDVNSGLSSTSYNGNSVNFSSSGGTSSGGRLIIVDPPYFSTNSSILGTYLTPAYTVVFGDGVSLTSGTSAGFGIANLNQLGSVTVKASPNGNASNRFVKLNGSVTISGNLQLLDSNATLNLNNNILSVYGNIYVDTSAILLTEGTLVIGGNNPLYGPTGPQTLLSYGHIKMATNNSINFNNLSFDNAYPQGVTLKMGNCVAGTVSFDNGRVQMADDSTMFINSIPVGLYGWLNGRMALAFPASNLVNVKFLIGDSISPLEVTINNALNATQQFVNNDFLTMKVIGGDHPQLALSDIDASKSLNQYVQVKSLGGLSFTPGQTELVMKYRTLAKDLGANSFSFNVAKLNANNWLNQSMYTQADSSVSFMLDLNQFDGEYAMGELKSIIIPSIVTQPQNVAICENANAQFSVVSSANNTFEWQEDTGAGWITLSNNLQYAGVNSPTLTIINASLAMNGNQYRCVVTNNGGSVVSSVAVLSVGTGVTPALSIVADTTTICANQSATFTANAVNGGAMPVYQWYINNVLQSASTPTVQFANLPNGATVYCKLLSSLNCAAPAIVQSNSIVMTVNSLITPSIVITPTSTQAICSGDSLSFTYALQNAGNNPQVQWYKNNVLQSGGSSYSATFTNGNTVYAQLTSNAACLLNTTVNSNVYTVTATTPVTPTVTISSASGNNVCSGVPVTFSTTANNPGATPIYTWFVNGIQVGANTPTYTSSTLTNGSIVKCVLQTSLSCVTTIVDTSNTLSMTVTPSVTPVLNIATVSNDTICQGASVTFTPNVQNAGTSSTYAWYVNNAPVASGASFTTTALGNGNAVYAIVTTNPTCATTTTDTSNVLLFTVLPNLIPAVNVNASSNTICFGDSVLCVASPTNGGLNPIYTWKKNGLVVGTNSTTYNAVGLFPGDQIICEMQSSETCITATTVVSNVVAPTINSVVIPQVNVSSLQSLPLCAGQNATFICNINNGGVNPTYQWSVNGTNVATTANFSSTTINDGDVIQCIIHSNATCANPDTAVGDFTAQVAAVIVPAVTISANPGTTVVNTQAITFTASGSGGGSSPVYQWYLNSGPVGTNSVNYTNNAWQNGDEVKCIMSSNATCAIPDTVESNILKISATNVGLQDDVLSEFLRVFPNPNSGVLYVQIKDGVYFDAQPKFELNDMMGRACPILSEASKGQGLYQILLPNSTARGDYFLSVEIKGQKAIYRITVL